MPDLLRRRSLLLGLSAWPVGSRARQEGLTLYTENFPPMNFTAPGGALFGWNVDVVQDILDRADLPARIEPLPWARALLMARQTPQSGLFPVTRTTERDAWFRWIGMISEPQGGIVVLRDSRWQPQRLEDLHGLRIGVVHNDIRHDWLLREGFAPGRELDMAPSHVSNLRKLLYGRIDCWPVNLALARYLALQEGADVLPRLRLALPIDSAALSAGLWRGNWLALHPQAPPAWVAALTQAHAASLKAGVMEQARRKWQGDWTEG
jgi:polar amino acid transport system substrate-binding protein